MRLLVIAAAVAVLARGGCIDVNSSDIVAHDLVSAVPLFAQLDPGTHIGYTPFPGIQRVFSSREVFEIATRNGLSFAPGERAPRVCVQRAVRTLSVDEIKPVLLSVLGIPNIEMEILEVSAQPVPLTGRLEYRSEGVNRRGDPQIPVTWCGRYVYDGHRSLSVWAKARLSVSRREIVAAEAIAAGAAISPSQVRSVILREFPILEPSSTPLLTVERISGMVARRTIAAGEKITLTALEAPKDVRRGETVRIHVIAGGATLSLDAIAEASGNKGETIVVRNPSSGKNFHALIEGHGEAVLRFTPGETL